jgi:hypothetical protein
MDDPLDAPKKTKADLAIGMGKDAVAAMTD